MESSSSDILNLNPHRMMNKIRNILLVVFSMFLAAVSCNRAAEPERPNILFIIADDISRNSMGAYGCNYISTPHFDRIAAEGVRFENAFVTNPKCAPARACLLTGRYSWQLEEACNHWAAMPEKWVFYPDLIEASGYFMGFTGKGWAPGTFMGLHNPAGWEYNDITCDPPYKNINKKDYVANFQAFLQKLPEDTPFCFWLGTHEAHRAFEKDVHIKGGIDPDLVDVQECLPDNELVRNDLADYGVEVEYHDAQIGKCLRILEERGMLDNTVIVATSDHGMAFPHIKGQVYNEGFHVAFAVRWGDRIKPGRVVEDFINFPDVAPTFMEIAGLEPHAQMTGKSFLDLLLSKRSGKISIGREFALLGKERHDIGRTDGDQLTVGYPVRAIRSVKYLYAMNFKPHRWPAGDPEYDYPNCDASPTKAYLTGLTETDADFRFFEYAFGKRPEEELYDLENDPDCIHNLANDPELQKVKEELRNRMTMGLVEQEDPRIQGNGDIFDDYPHGNTKKLQEFYGEDYYDMNEAFRRKYPN